MDGIASSSPKTKPVKPQPRRRLGKAICITVLTAVLIVVLVMVILGFTVFKPKRAVTTVDSVDVQDLDFSVDMSRVRVNVNVTLSVDISVKNRNRVGFRYTNASALVYYNGTLVGEAPIPAGKIGARETVGMNLTLSVMADRLLENPGVYSDVISGSLPLSTSTRISGKVSVLFVKIGVVSYSNCDLTIDVLSRTVKNSVCKYKTKL